MYGILKDDISHIDNKINFQKEYLKKYAYNFNEDIDTTDYLNSVYSANLNPKKYFSEINNRVNTMVQNAKEMGLKPIFITITAPTKYHKKYSNGDYVIDPNETAKEITQIWNKFTNLQVFQRMKKDNYNLNYFRVYEPHKSGVPHLHALLFLPTSYILEVKKVFYKYFTSDKWGANIKGIGFRYTWYNEKGGAVGYVMKYILKTFKNEESEKIELAVYWYIKYRVRRFLSSRSLCKLSLYRKVRYYFKDMFKYDLMEIKRLLDNNFIYYSEDGYYINYRYFNEDGELQDDIIWAKNTESQINAKQHTDNRFHIKYKREKEVKDTVYVVDKDNKKTHFYNEDIKKIVKINKPISKMSNYELLNHKDENFDNSIILRLVHNEMIDRKMLNKEKTKISKYTRDEYLMNSFDVVFERLF